MDIRNICQTCGSGAFGEIEEVFIRCSLCQESAHVYCLEMSHLEYFQGGKVWYCGDCRGEDMTTFLYDDDDDVRDYCESMEAEEMLRVSTDKNLKANKTMKMKKKGKKAKKKKKQRESIAEKTVLQTILEGNEDAEEEEINCDNGHELGHDEVNHAPRKDLPDVADVAVNNDENAHFSDFTYDDAHPVCRPTWTGDFKIYNKVKKMKHIVLGVDAHLSIIACTKVLEAAKFLKPYELVLDLVRRTDVWPKCYDTYKPSDKSIALYIFPQNETDDETNGKRLKELVRRMVKEDLSMKLRVGSDEKAELLVFTSRMLPKGDRRMNFQRYLWGVFKENVSSQQ